MKKVYLKIEILAIILIVLMSIFITPKTFQNDTFYTISIGEHIKNNWIDMKDPFSWHENLEYTYPHWAYDFTTYLIYSVFRTSRDLYGDYFINNNFRDIYVFL